MDTGGGGGWSFGTKEESTATGVQRAKQRDSYTEDWCVESHQHSLAQEACLLTCRVRWELGAEAWGFERSYPRERTGVAE